MRKYFAFCVILFLTSCSTKVSVTDFKFLNGHWKISSVKMPDGQEKNFQDNGIVDYFVFKDFKGSRQKLVQQPDATFLANPLKENFLIKENNNQFDIFYQTNQSSWSERVISITQENLVLQNEQQIIYTYRKIEPIKNNE